MPLTHSQYHQSPKVARSPLPPSPAWSPAFYGYAQLRRIAGTFAQGHDRSSFFTARMRSRAIHPASEAASGVEYNFAGSFRPVGIIYPSNHISVSAGGLFPSPHRNSICRQFSHETNMTRWASRSNGPALFKGAHYPILPRASSPNAPQVIAVQFDQVEGVEEYAVVSAVVTDEIERGNAVVIASDSFAVDDAGARTQASQKASTISGKRRVRSLPGGCRASPARRSCGQ